MMLKRLFISIFTITLLVSLALNIYSFTNGHKHESHISGQLRAEIDSLRYLSTLERNYAVWPVSDNDKMLNAKLTFHSDSTGKFDLPGFLTRAVTSPKLVVRYSDVNCNTCVDSLFTSLAEFSDRIGEQNVIIMASYHNRRDLFVWKRLNNIRYNVFQVPHDQMGLEIERKNIPFVFILLPGKGAVHQIFLPMKENTERTRVYLEYISRRFFDKRPENKSS